MAFQVSAGAVVLDVIADAYVDDFPRDGVPDAVVNTNALILERGVISATGIPFDSRPVLAFDLSSYGGLTLLSATLSAWGATTHFSGIPPLVDPFQTDLVAYSGNGTVDLADFSQPGTLAGTPTIPTGAVNQFGGVDLALFNVDVTTAVQALLDSHTSFGEFRFEADEERFFAFIAAGEVPPPFPFDEALRPTLSLDFTPQPQIPESGTMTLISFGLLGLGARRRRSVA